LPHKGVCPAGCQLRPHVVWFGEAVPAYEEAAEILVRAEILIVLGTSLQAYPAAGLIHYASEATQKYIIDPKADELDIPRDFERISKNASEGMQEIISKLFAEP